MSGEVVVCIRGFSKYLIQGSLYTIARAWRQGDILPTGNVSDKAYSLYGVPDMTPESGNAFAWSASRFRKFRLSDLPNRTNAVLERHHA